jgi:hypothetical protein
MDPHFDRQRGSASFELAGPVRPERRQFETSWTGEPFGERLSFDNPAHPVDSDAVPRSSDQIPVAGLGHEAKRFDFKAAGCAAISMVDEPQTTDGADRLNDRVETRSRTKRPEPVGCIDIPARTRCQSECV